MDKREILDTIKLMAKENGGKPPGQNAFKSATGVGRNSWFPKIWLNWGDALTDAGFEANSFKSKFEEEFLIAKLVELSRELGRYPTFGDIILKKREDKDFPGKSALQRWGNMSFRLTKILEYCNSHRGFDDVALYCSEVLVNKTTVVDKITTPNEIGYVYLIQHGSRREYKIGRTKNPMRREGELRIELPEELKPIHTIKTDDPAGIERYWHERFKDKRKKGEWFALSQGDVLSFKKWKRIV